jgi:hypothetical protein
MSEYMIVCPDCYAYIDAEKCKRIRDIHSGIVFGYYARCEKCGKQHFINKMDRPPWFDLSNFYAGYIKGDEQLV